MRLSPGLYRIWWSAGGSSLAAVGMTSDGERWLAPTNWVSPAVPFKDWHAVLRAEPIHVDSPAPVSETWKEHIRTAAALLDTILSSEEEE